MPPNEGDAAPGSSFQNEVGYELRGFSDEVFEEVEIETKSGTRVRLDFVSVHDGEFKLTEAKSSETAGVTANQRTGIPEIEQSGGIVTSQNKPNLPAGTEIPPTRTRIVRPSTLERLRSLRAAIERMRK